MTYFSSLKKSCVTFVILAEVVIRTFGRVLGSKGTREVWRERIRAYVIVSEGFCGHGYAVSGCCIRATRTLELKGSYKKLCRTGPPSRHVLLVLCTTSQHRRSLNPGVVPLNPLNQPSPRNHSHAPQKKDDKKNDRISVRFIITVFVRHEALIQALVEIPVLCLPCPTTLGNSLEGPFKIGDDIVNVFNPNRQLTKGYQSRPKLPITVKSGHTRIISGVIPANRSSSAVSCEWVIVAGWTTNVFVSPMLAKLDARVRLSTNLLPSLTPKFIIPPKYPGRKVFLACSWSG